MSERKDLDLTAAENHGWSALSYACENGHTQIVQFLVKTIKETFGNDEMIKILNKPDKSGKTNVFLGARYGHTETVSYLLTLEGCDFKSATNGLNAWTPLHISAWKGHLEVVKSLLENASFLKDEKKEYLEMEDKRGRKAIDLARKKNRSEIVEVYMLFVHPTIPCNLQKKTRIVLKQSL